MLTVSVRFTVVVEWAISQLQKKGKKKLGKRFMANGRQLTFHERSLDNHKGNVQYQDSRSFGASLGY